MIILQKEKNNAIRIVDFTKSHTMNRKYKFSNDP